MTIFNNVMEQGQVLGKNSAEMGKTVVFAGLGMFSYVEEKSINYFNELVGMGKDYHSDDITTLKDKVESLNKNVRTKFNEKEAILETKIHNAFSGVLHRLGVPTKDEVRTLIEHVEELTSKIEKLKK